MTNESTSTLVDAEPLPASVSEAPAGFTPRTADGAGALGKFRDADAFTLTQQIRSWRLRKPVVTTTFETVPMYLPDGNGMSQPQLLALLIALHDANADGIVDATEVRYQDFGGADPPLAPVEDAPAGADLNGVGRADTVIPVDATELEPRVATLERLHADELGEVVPNPIMASEFDNLDDEPDEPTDPASN